MDSSPLHPLLLRMLLPLERRNELRLDSKWTHSMKMVPLLPLTSLNSELSSRIDQTQSHRSMVDISEIVKFSLSRGRGKQAKLATDRRGKSLVTEVDYRTGVGKNLAKGTTFLIPLQAQGIRFSFRLGKTENSISAPVAAATAVFLIYPIGQGSFSDGMPLGISGTFNFMIVFQEKNLMHPFHMLGVAGVFGGSLFSAMHGSLVTSSLIRAFLTFHGSRVEAQWSLKGSDTMSEFERQRVVAPSLLSEPRHAQSSLFSSFPRPLRAPAFLPHRGRRKVASSRLASLPQELLLKKGRHLFSSGGIGATRHGNRLE
ncbi:UNVERIFIED_CONTAM: Photosystem II protein D1 [Sesamum calycinum]|uniref:Photosystem II protein D1 n=1 Tax=Sesamum calycinum TaxID=2727403 RepID=A0AAW2J3G4_9LAMI